MNPPRGFGTFPQVSDMTFRKFSITDSFFAYVSLELSQIVDNVSTIVYGNEFRSFSPT